MLITLIASAFIFGMLVLFHEFGHFITAKSVGMRVDEFAIGFGPKILSKKYGETTYSLRAIPLGGFNDIAGMDPSYNESTNGRGYCEKPIWARMIVILAGSIMNFILPIFLFWGIFFVAGVSTPSTEPILGDVIKDKPAYLAGLKSGDKIITINGNKITKWDDIVLEISNSAEKVLKVEFEREKELKSTSLIPIYDSSSKRSLIGVTSSSTTVNITFLEAGKYALVKTGFIISKMLEGVFLLFTGEASTEVSGPLGVAQMAGEVAHIGFLPLLNFAAILSLNLGIINLIPIPALDGGHFFTLLLEALRGKPLNPKIMHYTQMFGVTILIMIMIFATKNDVVKIFSAR